ncbi:hypothetical protein Tco_0556859 [Tanacetum coccineum]
MKRHSKGFSGVITPLFQTMLIQAQSLPTIPQTSPSRITSLPSISPQTHQPSPPPQHTSHETEEPALMPHDSPLQSVHSLGRDEGCMQHNELTVLVTKLTERIGVLENDLLQTKKVYSSTLTKLILRVKKLEKTVKTTKARRRARIIVSEDEEDLEDPSNQGRKIDKIDKDPSISLQEEPTKLVKDQGSGEKGQLEVTTADTGVNTSRRTQVSTAERIIYTRRSAEKRKDKGKAIMTESEPPKTIKKRVQVQMRIDEELAKKVFEKEQAKAMAEQEQEMINLESALELQRQLDEMEEVPAEAIQAPVIDWNDPSVIRYHALQNRPRSVAEAKKNMCRYLTNQGGHKMQYFKGMRYDDIRPIFKRKGQEVHEEPAETQKTETKQVEKESSKKEGGTRRKSLARKRTGEKQSEESSKRKKVDDAEIEELKSYLDITPQDEFVMEVQSLATKYPIVDWETHMLTENFTYYKIIRADGSSKNYKIFSEMFYDFDRHDVLDLHRLVKERYTPRSPEGYDLMLWGNLKTLFEPGEDNEIWTNQHEYNLIQWRLCDSSRIHILLMENGIAIHMLVEKKYPHTQEMISKMLNGRLEVDQEKEMALELVRFVKS